MIDESQLSDLTLRLTKNSNCGMRLFFLLSLPLLLLLFAIGGYLKLINFNIEMHSIVMIGFIFVIYTFFMFHNAYFASCKLRKHFRSLKIGLLEFINKNLLEIAGYSKSNGSLNEFMDALAKKMRNENFASVAAGIFPTLGILGTFISIAISMPDFTSHTSEVLEREISTLLGGVGTAFYVSIYGIFLSIWWIFFEKTGLSKFQKDVRTITEETKDMFWQKEEIEQTYFRKSMENFEKLNAVFDTFTSQEFLNNLNDTIAQRMNVFEKIIAHEQDASMKVAEILQESTLQLQTISRHQNDLSFSLAELIKRFESFSQELKHNDESFLQAHKVLGNDFEKAISVAEILSQNTVKLNEALENINAQNVQKLYSGVLANIESMKQEIDSIGKSFDKHISSYDALFLERLRNTLRLIDSETAQIIEQIAKLRD